MWRWFQIIRNLGALVSLAVNFLRRKAREAEIRREDDAIVSDMQKARDAVDVDTDDDSLQRDPHNRRDGVVD